MSKEFEKLQEQAKQDVSNEKARRIKAYQYARSVGFPTALARRLMGSGKERIDRLAKEL